MIWSRFSDQLAWMDSNNKPFHLQVVAALISAQPLICGCRFFFNWVVLQFVARTDSFKVDQRRGWHLHVESEGLLGLLFFL